MKSNQVLKSTDRELFGVVIKQETKGHNLSVSDLQRAYETARWQHGWSLKRVDNVMDTKDFIERCFYLLEKRNLIKTGIHGFTEMVEREGIVKVLKGLGVWATRGRGENKSVYCNPYIWTLLAMELNPMIYATVVIWLADSLIFDRIEAGNEYAPMNSAIKRIVHDPDYAKFAKIINTKVFGYHQSGMRNTGTAAQLRKIAEIERFITQGINMGMIKTEAGVLMAIERYK